MTGPTRKRSDRAVIRRWAAEFSAKAERSARGTPELMLVDAQSRDLRLQRLTGHAQPGGSARWAPYTAAGLRQSTLDHLSFEVRRCRHERTRSSGLPVRLDDQPTLVDGEYVAIAQDDRPLDDVLELSHVAGPVVRLKQREGILAHVSDCLSGLLRVALDQVLHEQRDVIETLTQRRNADGKDT